MDILRRALDAGFVVGRGDTCAQRPGGVLLAKLDACQCDRYETDCPVRLALEGRISGATPAPARSEAYG